MAKIEWKGIEAYQDQLAALSVHAEGYCKRAVYEGAAVIVEAVKEECPVDTGSLKDSIGLSKMQNENGYINTKLGFDGYDEKGSPNVVKARVINSGSSTVPKNPFVRRAVNRAKKSSIEAMANAFAESLEQNFNK